MEVFRYDSPRHGWRFHAESAPGFWPLGEPQRMADGNWIVGGAVPHRWPRADAAVAISAGDDLSQWRVVIIPADQVTWGETALLVHGSLVRTFIRPPADGLPLRTAVSDDCGRTWTRQTATNLPVSASKACAGRLSDGRCYLIVNLPVAGLGPRDTLAVFLAPAAASAFRGVGIVRQGPSPAPRTHGAGISRQWAYLYAHEHAGRLYVAYAGTKENAELSVLELAALAPGA